MHVAIKAHSININTTEDRGESSSRSGTLGGLYNEMPSNPDNGDNGGDGLS